MSGRHRTLRRWVAALAVLLLLGGALLVLVRGKTFSARAEPFWVEEWLARGARSLATPRWVRGMQNPLEATPLNVAEGRDHFADHCAICHANDGSGETAINKGLYPRAPDLRGAKTQGLTDGELFFIIREGIRFTGMPGWGGDDAENWKLVLLIRHLPKLSPEERELMKEINDERY